MRALGGGWHCDTGEHDGDRIGEEYWCVSHSTDGSVAIRECLVRTYSRRLQLTFHTSKCGCVLPGGRRGFELMTLSY